MTARQAPNTKIAMRLRSTVLALLLAWPVLFVNPWLVRADDFSRVFGSFVGVATVEDLATGEQQQRDLDIVVSPYHKDGLKIDWITVGLVDGRRDVPGVKRWSQTAIFKPSDDGDFMVEAGEGSLFKERDEMEAIKGDPVRWSRIEGDTFHACSFVVLEDGRYELQVYQRILTDAGMDILFERIVDGEVVRRVSGTTIRVE